MRKTALALLICLVFPATASYSVVEISVDASTSVGPVNTRIFGHNTQHQNGCNGLWNASGGSCKKTRKNYIDKYCGWPYNDRRFAWGSGH